MGCQRLCVHVGLKSKHSERLGCHPTPRTPACCRGDSICSGCRAFSTYVEFLMHVKRVRLGSPSRSKVWTCSPSLYLNPLLFPDLISLYVLRALTGGADNTACFAFVRSAYISVMAISSVQGQPSRVLTDGVPKSALRYTALLTSTSYRDGWIGLERFGRSQL